MMRGAAILALAVALAACAEKGGDPQETGGSKPPVADASSLPVPQLGGGAKAETGEGEASAGGEGSGGAASGGAASGGAASAGRVATNPGIAPRIYMALQPDPAGPLSIVFAIDGGRDGTPDNDPAIRLTPENGKCNPQELRTYAFPADSAKRPVFGPDEVASGLTAKELPNFMAMSVTAEMMRQGIVKEVEDSKPQNVCTRKLWEQLIVNESQRTG